MGAGGACREIAAIWRKDTKSMISRILVAFAAVLASVGLLLYGMGTSYQPRDEGLERWGVIMMVAGVIGLAVGIVWYRKVEEAEEEAVAAEIRRRSS